ncbi:MAG: M23 family metallopeptidase [Campylobacterales bacterium]|nr:M23 family metallopeptidase [Campylobacterales bacterium]
MRFLVLFFSLVFTVFGLEINLSSTDIQNGKSVFVELKKEKNVEFLNVVMGKESYKVFEHPTDASKLYTFIPISYYEKPEIKELKVEYKIFGKKNSSFMMLEIKDGNYKKETITVSSDKVNPKDEAIIKRTQKEYKEAIDIYNTVTPKSYINSKFILPLDTKITSEFGKARVYNGALKSYHGGTDFRAKTPLPIKCVNDGKVVLVSDRFYAGNSVVVDHGHGVYSCYFHLSKFKVKNGEMVKKGQILGLSGSTGRITGPHLHFGIRLGGMQVDPMQFIEVANKNLFKKRLSSKAVK